MNVVIPWLVCFALLLILVFAVYAAIKNLQKKDQEIKRLEAELDGQKKINQELLQYTKEIAKINSDKEDVAQQIQEAENDEEVMAIIAGLVHINNDRVRK
jgi:septal ring factor EnvC (AmiA/AmiB activator)